MECQLVSYLHSHPLNRRYAPGSSVAAEVTPALLKTLGQLRACAQTLAAQGEKAALEIEAPVVWLETDLREEEGAVMAHRAGERWPLQVAQGVGLQTIPGCAFVAADARLADEIGAAPLQPNGGLRVHADHFLLTGDCGPSVRFDSGPFLFRALEQVLGESITAQGEGSSTRTAEDLLPEKQTALQRMCAGQTLTPEEVLLFSAPRRATIRGVYFLLKQDRIVYVGKSADCAVRTVQHADKDHDGVAMIPVPEHISLDEVEGRHIVALRPELNLVIPRGYGLIGKQGLKEQGVSALQLKRWMRAGLVSPVMHAGNIYYREDEIRRASAG